jgi:pilus assembly protein CpaF
MFARREGNSLHRPFGNSAPVVRRVPDDSAQQHRPEPVAKTPVQPAVRTVPSPSAPRSAPPAARPALVAPMADGSAEETIAQLIGKVPTTTFNGPMNRRIVTAKEHVHRRLMEVVDVAETLRMKREELETEIGAVTSEILRTMNLELSAAEEVQLKEILVNDMLGLGPLEPLLHDPAVTDIMVNGPDQIYIERHGKLELTDIAFRDRQHVMMVATRICAKVNRRIDEANALVDARLDDGSRVNIIIPPLALDGPYISIRKFAKRPITLEMMVRSGNISAQMCEVLSIASACRLNIIISGGTGAGKTTLLNALSRRIDHGERIVTIEDTAELQLQQPHVLRHETRQANVEGEGEVTMRDLVRNALRMRPDRIILGEARGAEAFDMLQAMNTGHEGSMSTIHANRPREALARLENMICMSGIALPGKAIRSQIADAIDLIVQIKRCRDGVRRVTHVVEVIGMEHDVITTQDLFAYEYEGTGEDGKFKGEWRCSGILPYFTQKAKDYDLGDRLREVVCGEAGMVPQSMSRRA